jgi:hypothetical protein
MRAPGDPEYEDETLITRVSSRPAYVARGPSVEAALRLKARGLVTLENGEGRDEGLLIVRRVPGVALQQGFGR